MLKKIGDRKVKNSKLKIKRLFILAIICAADATAQQVAFNTAVDKNPVAADEQCTLEFTVTTSGATARNFKAPDLSKFLILSGPNQSTSMQIINGAVSSSQTYSYVIQARGEGKFSISPATIEVSGRSEE